MRRAWVGLALLAATTVVWAADYYEGLAAYRGGDYAEAIRQWRPLAEAGNLDAQFRLGQLYSRPGRFHDRGRALDWYRRAAKLGHAGAQNDLGLAYDQGRGVEADPTAAAEWYRRAANQGLPVAQSNLARLYEEGRGVEEGPARAARLYRDAAASGHTQAQFRLGVLYEEGRGVERNVERARKLYRKAAKRGHPEAAGRLEELLVKGRHQPRDWSAEDAAIAELKPELIEATVIEPEPDVVSLDEAENPAPERATAETAAIIERAEAGDVDAQYLLGRRYSVGDGVARSAEESAVWNLRAAESGHPAAGYTMGFMYMRGRGVERDNVQAYRWFRISAERNVGDAQTWLDKLTKTMRKSELAEARALVH